MFVELALRGVRDGGYAAQIAPAGLYGGANASAIRQHVFDQNQLLLLLGCENNGQSFFPGVHPQTWFTLYAARRGGRTERFRIAFGCEHPEQVKPLVQAAMVVKANLIRNLSPDTYAIPDVRKASDISVSEKMYDRCPAFGDTSSGPPVRHYQREIDMGNDRGLFTTDPTGLPVYEGRMIDHFDHRAKTYETGHGNSAVWIARSFDDPAKAIVPQWRVLRADVPSKLGDRVDRYRIGFGDVANPRNQRSFISTLIPPGTICGHTVPTIVFQPDMEWGYLPWLAVANTFTMDALARKKLSSPHMTFSVVDSLPFPRPGLTDAWVQRLAPLVLRLVCTAPEMTDYWNEMAKLGLCAPAVPGTVPPAALLDEEARAEARAEIDAVVACDVFGLTRQELFDILDTFPVLRRREERAHGEFRTKRLVLDAYDSVLTGPTVPVAIDAASLPDGVWERPMADQRAESGAAIAAVLKAFGEPVSARTARLAAILVLEPRLATPSFDGAEAELWRRLVGAEAEPLPSGVTAFAPPADHAWGAAVRQLRGSGLLVEDSAANTWAPGPGLDAIETEGWSDGRARMIRDLLQRRDERKLEQQLPDAVRRWIDAAAA